MLCGVGDIWLYSVPITGSEKFITSEEGVSAAHTNVLVRVHVEGVCSSVFIISV